MRQPMTAIVERLARRSSRRSRPSSSRARRSSMYRIYRDTRFSENKTPYKTHVAAVFPPRGLPKHEGAGAVLPRLARRSVDRRRHVRAADAAAARRPRAHRRQRQTASRDRRVAGIPPACRRARGRAAAARAARLSQGSPGRRVPEVPAVSRRRRSPAAFATSPRFYGTLLDVFRQVVPLARFLNAPAAARRAMSSADTQFSKAPTPDVLRWDRDRPERRRLAAADDDSGRSRRARQRAERGTRRGSTRARPAGGDDAHRPPARVAGAGRRTVGQRSAAGRRRAAVDPHRRRRVAARRRRRSAARRSRTRSRRRCRRTRGEPTATRGIADGSFRTPDLGRFRINLHHERGRAAAAIRRLPSDRAAASRR